MRRIAIVSLFSLLIAFPVQSTSLLEERITYFSGKTWGAVDHVATCADNPMRIEFSEDRSTVAFNFESPAKDYKGGRHDEYRYTVEGMRGGGIILALEDEQRLTADGELIVWVLQEPPFSKPNSGYFCWGRTDYTENSCVAMHKQCVTNNLS